MSHLQQVRLGICSIPDTLLPKIPSSPFAAIVEYGAIPSECLDGTLTFSDDVFKLLLQLSILITEVADNGLLEGTLRNSISYIYIKF